jgi:hypothetical protein
MLVATFLNIHYLSIKPPEALAINGCKKRILNAHQQLNVNLRNVGFTALYKQNT